jgi:hypothetical protein
LSLSALALTPPHVAVDVERDADLAIAVYLDKQEPIDKQTGVTVRELEKFVGWWWPRKESPPPASKLVPSKL